MVVSRTHEVIIIDVVDIKNFSVMPVEGFD